MSNKRRHSLRCSQVFILGAFMLILAVPDAAGAPRSSAQGGGNNERKTQCEYLRPDTQHFSPGAAEGVQFRRNVPTFQHEVSRAVPRPSPNGPGAPGRDCSPRHIPHRPCYRPYRSYWYYYYPARSYWVPGHYEWVYKEVWIPGYWENRHIPAVYRREVYNGREIVVLVADERWERVWVEGRYETHREQVWISGYWAPY